MTMSVWRSMESILEESKGGPCPHGYSCTRLLVASRSSQSGRIPFRQIACSSLACVCDLRAESLVLDCHLARRRCRGRRMHNFGGRQLRDPAHGRCRGRRLHNFGVGRFTLAARGDSSSQPTVVHQELRLPSHRRRVRSNIPTNCFIQGSQRLPGVAWQPYMWVRDCSSGPRGGAKTVRQQRLPATAKDLGGPAG